jgi:hypothetical protein
MQQKAITLFHGDFFREVSDDVDTIKMYVSRRPTKISTGDYRCKYIHLRGKGSSKLVGYCYKMAGSTDVISLNVKAS